MVLAVVNMTSDKCITIALDVMGSDSGETGIIQGGLDAARRFGRAVHILFVGRKEIIEKALAGFNDLPENISIEHADEEVPMNISAIDGVRKKNSSIKIGLMQVRRKKADAFVSTGNTGAVMGTALFTLGRIKGVFRPAITSVFPTWTGRPIVVLDVGANAEGKPSHLSQFVRLGPLGRRSRARLTASSIVASICSCTAPSFANPPAILLRSFQPGSLYDTILQTSLNKSTCEKQPDTL